MNFLTGVLRGGPNEMTLDTEAVQIRFPPDRSRRLSAHAGLQVLLGVRPEDIHSPGFLPARVKGYPIDARVDVTEMLGNETLLHLVLGGQGLLARVDPRTRARPGQTIEVQLDVDRLHVFDAKTQRVLDRIEIPEEMREAPGALAVP
jgi:multiple sugar transport system ATP-binding protein